MNTNKTPQGALRVAYLAPEIPALSSTFVYEEILALERRGITVLPVSVRRPAATAEAQAALAARTRYLYDASPLAVVASALAGLPRFGAGAVKAARWLLADMGEVGWLRPGVWKLGYQFLAAVGLARFLKDNQCAHLHVHFAHVPAQIAMYASALSGVPFTIVAHANDIFERGLLLQRKAERALRLITISGHNLRYLESLGIPRERLAVVRCGVSFPTSARARRSDGAVLKVGTLGRMVEKKGFDVLIRAVAVLASAGRALELDIAGDGPLREELENLALALGVADRVRFIGSMPHHRVAAWMQQLDAFVLACKQDRNGDMDGIPVVLMEAMSQSVPVISTRLSGIPELVVHEESGLLARPDDHDDLARQIARLIESPELAEAIGNGGREHVVREFGQAINIDRLLAQFGLPTPTGRD